MMRAESVVELVLHERVFGAMLQRGLHKRKASFLMSPLLNLRG
jgi:hypothetical protein